MTRYRIIHNSNKSKPHLVTNVVVTLTQAINSDDNSFSSEAAERLGKSSGELHTCVLSML